MIIFFIKCPSIACHFIDVMSDLFELPVIVFYDMSLARKVFCKLNKISTLLIQRIPR